MDVFSSLFSHYQILKKIFSSFSFRSLRKSKPEIPKKQKMKINTCAVNFTMTILLFYQKIYLTAAEGGKVFLLSDLLKDTGKNKSRLDQSVRLALKSSSRNTTHNQVKQGPRKESSASSSSCQIHTKTQNLRVSKFCEEVSYTAFRCDGYCPSSAFFYGEEAVNRHHCCAMKGVKKATRRIYCARRLKPADIENFYANHHDVNAVFRNSFSESKWFQMSPFSGFENYKGYYVVEFLQDAHCSCQRI